MECFSLSDNIGVVVAATAGGGVVAATVATAGGVVAAAAVAAVAVAVMQGVVGDVLHFSTGDDEGWGIDKECGEIARDLSCCDSFSPSSWNHFR